MEGVKFINIQYVLCYQEKHIDRSLKKTVSD